MNPMMPLTSIAQAIAVYLPFKVIYHLAGEGFGAICEDGGCLLTDAGVCFVERELDSTEKGAGQDDGQHPNGDLDLFVHSEILIVVVVESVFHQTLLGSGVDLNVGKR